MMICPKSKNEKGCEDNPTCAHGKRHEYVHTSCNVRGNVNKKGCPECIDWFVYLIKIKSNKRRSK